LRRDSLTLDVSNEGLSSGARVRAVYRGDGSHLPSSATHSYSVAGAN
jgi:hypothetical protein